jgi:hypothetical protein
MSTNWPYDAGASEIGDRPDERLPQRAAGREHPPLQAPAAPVNIHARRATTAAPAGILAGGQAVADQPQPVRYWARQANVKSCWMCGTRLPAEQLVADGGSACPDLRWYCRDTRTCTERWTSRRARPATTGERTAGTPQTPGEQATGADADRPVAV